MFCMSDTSGPAEVQDVSYDIGMLCSLCKAVHRACPELNCRILVQTNGYIPENATLLSKDLASFPVLPGTDDKQRQGHGVQMHSGETFRWS